jgi:hypothetical protein
MISIISEIININGSQIKCQNNENKIFCQKADH